MLDGQPATIVGTWSDFDDCGYDLVMADGSKRWVSHSGARVRIKSGEGSK